ncbi:hypothetical protein DP117_29600 [Brasilonema sp. UFV-L1]|nr:hypothetical protein [Brasilonema sp. UFV-L1]
MLGRFLVAFKEIISETNRKDEAVRCQELFERRFPPIKAMPYGHAALSGGSPRCSNCRAKSALAQRAPLAHRKKKEDYLYECNLV